VGQECVALAETTTATATATATTTTTTTATKQLEKRKRATAKELMLEKRGMVCCKGRELWQWGTKFYNVAVAAAALNRWKQFGMLLRQRQRLRRRQQRSSVRRSFIRSGP